MIIKIGTEYIFELSKAKIRMKRRKDAVTKEEETAEVLRISTEKDIPGSKLMPILKKVWDSVARIMFVNKYKERKKTIILDILAPDQFVELLIEYLECGCPNHTYKFIAIKEQDGCARTTKDIPLQYEIINKNSVIISQPYQ